MEAKMEARQKKTCISGLDCAFSALCSICIAESESLGLMLTQSLCMDKSKDYCSKADTGKD